MSGDERQRRRSAGRVADEVERVEACIVGDATDPLDIGLKAVASWRDRAPGIPLDILGPGVDVIAEVRQQDLLGGADGKDPARQKDDRPPMFTNDGSSSRSRLSSAQCHPTGGRAGLRRRRDRQGRIGDLRSGRHGGQTDHQSMDFPASVRVARFRMMSLVWPFSSRTSMIDSPSVSAISRGT